MTELPAILDNAVWRRRVGLVWWTVGLIAVAALIALAYPTVRDNSALDKTFASLPSSVQAALGLAPGSALTSPVGYLNSQFFANVLPVMMLVFALGFGAWAVSGDEGSGMLELILANPVSRVRIVVERASALLVMLAVLTAVTALTLVALAPLAGLGAGAPAARIIEATLACAGLALTYGTLALAVGAATGSRAAALAVSSAAAVAGFVLQGLAEQVTALRPLRAAMPWHWLIDGNALGAGLGVQNGLLPVAVSLAMIIAAAILWSRRDLR
ncbi:MAG: ABC transporter permease [Candidatus Dormibacteria bacterium]